MNDAEARSILRAHGDEPPRRGRLSPELHARATHLRDQDEAGAPPDPGPPGDYDGGTTEADFPPGGGTAGGEPAGPAGDESAAPAERTPRRPAARRPSMRTRLRSGGGAGGKKARRHARVPVDRVVEMFWDGAARLAGQIDPPMGRVLSMQAPVAGLILEDVVKGTIADRFLQPVARAEDKAKKVMALAGPPVCVLGLEMAQQLPDRERQVREAIIIPILRESMVLWLDVAGDKVEAKAQRDAERAPVYEQVDALLGMIFTPPPGGPATPDAAEAAAQTADA